MRLVVLALGLGVGLSACGAHARGPAWPAHAATDEDGGESLAPRQVATADVEAAAEPEEEVAAAVAVTVEAPAAAVADPATAPPVITAPEEVINLDDIVIEIEEE